MGEAPKMEVKKRTVSFNDDADVVVVARIPEQFSAPKTKKKNKPKKKKSPQQQSPSISPMPAGKLPSALLDDIPTRVCEQGFRVCTCTIL